MKDCKVRAKQLIDEMNPEDVAEMLPLLEHISSLQETLKEANRELAGGKVVTLEGHQSCKTDRSKG